jgi:hypothetical protein
MRPSNIGLAVFGLAGLLNLATAADVGLRREEGARRLAETGRLARDLGLTDLCLFTEARYTRHPSQADLHTAFQDHPMSLDHFPSGSLMLPPRLITAFPKGPADASVELD